MRIGLVGDVMLGRSFNEIFAQDPYYNPWGNTTPLLSSLDGLIGNCEMAITSATRKYPKTFNFRLDPQFIDVLRLHDSHQGPGSRLSALAEIDPEAGLGPSHQVPGSHQVPLFTSMSLANNHSLDFYKEGLFDTKFYLNSLGVHSPGAGEDLITARMSAYFQINDVEFAHISASDHPAEWIAGVNKPGINYIDIKRGDYGFLIDQVRTEKQNKRKVIVSLHWGPNYEPEISPEKQRLAYDLSRLDCDIIHGHSAHHVQRIEMQGQTVVFYSCGDFIDDYAIDETYRNDLAMIGEVVYNGNLVDVNIHPTRIDHHLTKEGYRFEVNLLDKIDPDYDFVMTHI